ncbi:iron-containing alcohol dehydrogenase [Oceanobacillus kimchii]|uniref:iron-containing alcohol dehydrogenase n=1 Tax=Oceanobacillus kimchii TaxID=746691 RepID=UPI0021A9197E|nr:iron-containing alcohol dehydrogenase [Oceanobacillus kimchii]MCT1578421.1 iron-containing alcohol dehydrogenase [Oceanobacillus kimchii]MCT2134599.1 iron-containing alcohol dehydrogenase [Oceanobacillus kimchii]
MAVIANAQKQGERIVSFNDFQIPSVIRFGEGALATVKEEVAKKNPSKLFIISDKGVAQAGLVEKLTDVLKSLQLPVETMTDIAGEPSFGLVEKTIHLLNQSEADMVIGIGGGSALDVAKASAALHDKQNLPSYFSGDKVIENRTTPCVLLPTTSGTGAEVTKNAIFADEEAGLKRGIVSPALLPDAAIVDPELTVSCPARVTAASGVDAFTHAIESYISTNATIKTRIYSEKSMKLFAQHITNAVHNGSNIEGRTGMSWASLLGGVSLANAGVGAVHAMAYPLGGTYHIEHGVANALLMPYVFKVIGKTCIDDMVNVASFLEIGDYSKSKHDALDAVIGYLIQLLQDLNLPTSLKELGVKEADLPDLAEQASQVKRLLSNTPYRLSEEQILRIYEDAYEGGE